MGIKEVGHSSTCFEIQPSREPRRYLRLDRTFDGRRHVQPDTSSGSIFSFLHGEKLDRASLSHRILEVDCPLSVGRGRHFGQPEVGKRPAARARCCLLLLQLDQCAVDKGQWRLAAELSLEAPPPFATLGQHQSPNVLDGEMPYSRLLDTRWSDLAIAHIRGNRRLPVEERPIRPQVQPACRQRGFPGCHTKEKTKGQGKGQGFRRSLNNDPDSACPAKPVPSVDCSTSPEPKLPGEDASTVTGASLVNSLPRWLLKSKCNLSSFLHSIVAEPKDVDDRPTFRFGEADFSDRPLWPMAVPYPEVFTKKVDSDDAWLKKLISLQVVVLSWLHLGEPAAAPISLCFGKQALRRTMERGFNAASPQPRWQYSNSC